MSARLSLRTISERLLAHEAKENLTQAIRSPAADLVFAKLRPSLVAMMGDGGYRALLVRALALAGAEIAWPAQVQVRADGTLDGLDQFARQVDRPVFAEASVILISRLFGLLLTFVGEDLTCRLLREIWPEVAFASDPSDPDKTAPCPQK